jgi:hypothetical protein
MGSSKNARRRLTDEEREIRAGAGIPLKRWWPVLAILIVWTIAAANSQVFGACLGDPLEGRGRGIAAVRFAAIGPCSPYLLRGSPLEWLLFISMWAPIPFAILNWRWAKRHRAHWDAVRAREKIRRAEKRDKRGAEEAASKEQR